MDGKDLTTLTGELNQLFRDLKRIESLAKILGYAAYHEENLFGPTVWEVVDQIKKLAYEATEALYCLGKEHGIMTIKSYPEDSATSNLQ